MKRIDRLSNNIARLSQPAKRQTARLAQRRRARANRLHRAWARAHYTPTAVIATLVTIHKHCPNAHRPPIVFVPLPRRHKHPDFHAMLRGIKAAQKLGVFRTR